MIGIIIQTTVNSLTASEISRDISRKRRECMRLSLSHDEFIAWQAEEATERRHKELCNAIRSTKSEPVDQSSPSLGLAILGGALIGTMIE